MPWEGNHYPKPRWHLLRFRVMGRRFQVRERDYAAYQELINAGIMESDGDDLHFTDDGRARRGNSAGGGRSDRA